MVGRLDSVSDGRELAELLPFFQNVPGRGRDLGCCLSIHGQESQASGACIPGPFSHDQRPLFFA